MKYGSSKKELLIITYIRVFAAGFEVLSAKHKLATVKH